MICDQGLENSNQSTRFRFNKNTSRSLDTILDVTKFMMCLSRGQLRGAQVKDE